MPGGHQPDALGASAETVWYSKARMRTEGAPCNSAMCFSGCRVGVSKKLVGSYNTSIIKELPLYSLFFKPGMVHSWVLFWGFLRFDVMVSFCLSSRPVWRYRSCILPWLLWYADGVKSTLWLSTSWFWSGQLLVLLVLPASVLRPGLSDPAGLGTQSPDQKEAATGTRNHRSCRLRRRCADSPRRPSPLSGNLGL